MRDALLAGVAAVAVGIGVAKRSEELDPNQGVLDLGVEVQAEVDGLLKSWARCVLG